jgi:hypothetical protein
VGADAPELFLPITNDYQSHHQGIKMKKLNVTAIAAAVALACSAGAIAQTMSKDQYQSRKAGIALELKSARAGCDSFSANAKDVCIAEAKGVDGIAKAQLDADNKPSHDASYKVHVARADAQYSVAREKCDDSAGNVKDVCLKEAKAASVATKADAEARMKIAVANDKADQVSAKASNVASEKGTDARRNAASDKRDADYAVAKEKCDTFADDAKAACIKDAKLRFGQS